MSERTPQQEGRDWEPEFAKSVGGMPVNNSGAGFYKMDVRNLEVLWSLKWAGRHKSFRFEDEMMAECVRAIHGPGGIGGATIPALAFKTVGGEYVTLRKDDALMVMVEDHPGVLPASVVGAVDLSKRRPNPWR